MNPKHLFPTARMIMAWAVLFVSHLALAGDLYEPDETAAAAKIISNGQTQSRSIHAAGDVDWVKFTVGSNGATNVVIQTAGSYGDTEMWLYGPNSSIALLAYDDDSNGYFSRISQASLAAGTYYIKVQEYGNNAIIASYTLKASWTDRTDGNNTPATATAVANGQKVAASIVPIGDIDWYRFTVGIYGANNVVVETAGGAGATEMWLYGPNGSITLVAYNANGAFSRLSQAALAAGTYYVKVQEYGNNATLGAYTLRASWTDRTDGNNTAATATAVTKGQTVAAAINPIGDVDWYRFTIGSFGATNVVIETAGATGATEMWLYGPNGSTAQLAYNGNGAFARINQATLAAGTYYVKVQEYGNNAIIAAYTLKATWTDLADSDNTAATASAVTNGQTVTASINSIGDIDWHRFTVGSYGGTNAVIETALSAGGTEMWLYGPNNSTTMMAFNGYGSFSRISLANLAAGTYYVKVQEYGNDATIPAYTLKASWTVNLPPGNDGNDTVASATAVINGQTVTAAINPTGDVDWYRFSVGGNGAINVAIETAGAAGDSAIYLYGPNSSTTYAGYDDDGGVGSFSLINLSSIPAGTYYIQVQEFGNDSTIESYTLKATWSPAP